MPFRRHTTFVIAWIACFAIVLAALAPSISHALVAGKATAVVQADICTTHMASASKIDDKKQSLPASPLDPVQHFEHCPFCSSHTIVLGPLPNTVLQTVIPFGRALRPELFYHAPRPLFTWASAQSRAPPVL